MSDPLISYLPDLYREIRDFVELTETEDVEIGALQAAVDQLLNDQFVLTSSEDTIRRHERMLGILADKSTETLSFRRARIVNRYSTKPPFTIRYLQERLDHLVGVSGLVLAELDIQRFILKISVGIEDAAVLREIEHTVKTLKPANLVYQPTTFAAERIGVRTEAFAAGLNRQTHLSTTWKLGVTPLALRRNEVAI